MSSTSHTTNPHSNYQSIIDALGDYAKQTGIDLSNNPFAEKFEFFTSPDAILELLQERHKAFREYRDDSNLLNWLTPTVHVLHAFAGILGGASSLVSPMNPTASVLLFRMLISVGPLFTRGCNICRH